MKRTRRKFTDQQKQDILAEAESVKAAGGEYKEVLDRHSLASSTLAKWRSELVAKEKPHSLNRNASKPRNNGKASKLTLADISKTLATLDKELSKLNREREKLLDMKVSDLL